MTTSFYETSKAVSEYLHFHYATELDEPVSTFIPIEALDFPRRCGKLHERTKGKKGRALDLGCAVGGAAFAMSESFSEVIGIDFAHALIDAAKQIASETEIRIQIASEGDLVHERTVTLPTSAKPDRVTFQQGDAMNLPGDLGTFDFILMANLVDRLPDPRACLETIHEFVAKNGILAITSPFTWLEEYTPKEKWLGGYASGEAEVHSPDTLSEILAPNFGLLETLDLPFIIREHNRKNQFTVAHASLWQKK